LYGAGALDHGYVAGAPRAVFIISVAEGSPCHWSAFPLRRNRPFIPSWQPGAN